MTQQNQFVVTHKTARDRALKHLRGAFEVRGVTPVKVTRTYYDTFDWRLYAAELVLTTQPVPGGELALTLRDHSGQIRARARMTSEPGLAGDLPAGRLRDAVASLIDVRRLFALADLRVTTERLNLLNKDGKTVAAVTIDSGAIARRRKPLPSYLYVQPIKGYRRQLRKTVDTVAAVSGIEAAEQPRLACALQALGRTPLDYTSKFAVELESDTRADTAMKQLMRFLYHNIEVNYQGTLDDIDPEFLHDFRVAIRRTRSLLGRVRGVFPARTEAKFRDGFKWLGGITSGPRDLDVYMIEFAGYEQLVPAKRRADLVPLREHIAAERLRSQRALARALKSARYKRLIAAWTRFIEAPPSKRPTAPRAMLPITEVASAEVWRVYRKVLKQGRAIDNTSPADDLHELRKTAKQLRYLIEAFRSLYSAEDIEHVAAILKKLQAVLGTFQDLNVHGEALRGFSDALAKAGTGADTLMAMGVLTERMDARSHSVRKKFRSRFDEFDSPDYGALMKRVYRS